MRANRVLSIVLVLLLLASAVPLAVTPAGAQQAGIPGDADGDNELTKDELVNAILPYMLEEEGAHTLDDVGDAAWIYACWSGVPKTVMCDPPYGKEITIYRPIERIVVPITDGGEVLRILNAQDKVVGVSSDFINNPVFFPEFSKLPSVGSWHVPDVEAIFDLNPDIVIIYGFGATPETLEDILGENIKVVRFGYHKLNTLLEYIRRTGYILDRSEEAEEFIDWYEGYTNMIKSRTDCLSDDEKPRVYGEWNPFYARTKGSSFDLMCTAAGGINIAANISKGGYGAPNVDPEWIARENPDVIVRTTYAVTGFDTDALSKMAAIHEEIMSHSALADVNAVQNDSVHIQDYYHLTQGPGCLIGAAYIAKWLWLHSDLFEDLNPKAIHQEYLTRFQHLDYDLNEQGVFVYPPLEES